MMNLSCEEFEREYALQDGVLVKTEQRTMLEQHRSNCSYCQQFSLETAAVRETLLSIPKLDVPPYFWSNLKREINRLELGLKQRDWSTGFFPRFALLGSGFTAALVLGLLLLKPVQQQIGYPVVSSQVPTTNNVAVTPAPQQEHKYLTESPRIQERVQPKFVADSALADTTIHKFPERPGHDQITIHSNDDLWRVNQVSTTPADP